MVCSLRPRFYCTLTGYRYHGKCLKIARGKVKDDDKYTCPICDWRIRIPRDAARPKLEDLQAWQDEIQNLPFQPDEEDILGQIIDQAQNFRAHVAPFCNPLMATADESETQRFYLRKIEGAEILLAYETNFFRQELHKWSPVAPEPPPILEASKSTRKPRPTKLQKLMAQHGVDDPSALPQSLRTKAHNFNKRKSSEPTTGHPQPLQPREQHGRSDSGTPTSQNFPTHGHPPHPSFSYAPNTEPHFTMPGANPPVGSPTFAPHAYLHGVAGGVSSALQSPGFPGSPGQSRPAMYKDGNFARMDTRLDPPLSRGPLDSPGLGGSFTMNDENRNPSLVDPSLDPALGPSAGAGGSQEFDRMIGDSAESMDDKMRAMESSMWKSNMDSQNSDRERENERADEEAMSLFFDDNGP